MNVAKAVASYIVMQGRTDSDAVQRAFPHIQPKTIKKAIQNAYLQGRINIEQRGRPGWGRTPSILSAPLPDQPKLRGPRSEFTDPLRMRVASVWELASPKPPQIPELPGRIYTPLGAWSELEGAAAA